MMVLTRQGNRLSLMVAPPPSPPCVLKHDAFAKSIGFGIGEWYVCEIVRSDQSETAKIPSLRSYIFINIINLTEIWLAQT